MNVQEMSTEQIREQIIKVTDDMARIKGRLQESRTQVYRTGEYSDPDWYHRANEALRFRGIDIRQLQNELGKRNRQEKQARSTVSKSNFEKAARQILSLELFLEVANLANSFSTQKAD